MIAIVLLPILAGVNEIPSPTKGMTGPFQPTANLDEFMILCSGKLKSTSAPPQRSRPTNQRRRWRATSTLSEYSLSSFVLGELFFVLWIYNNIVTKTGFWGNTQFNDILQRYYSRRVSDGGCPIIKKSINQIP